MSESKTDKIFRASCHKIQFIGKIFRSLNLHDCDLSLNSLLGEKKHA